MPRAHINDIHLYYESYGSGFPLVLVGDEDPALEAAKLTHQQIPGAQLVILLQAGHLSNLDRPEAFNTSLLTFLQQVGS